MQDIKIEVSPENFPRTEGKIDELLQAITDEAIGYIRDNNLPGQAGISIALGLLFTAKCKIEHHEAFLQSGLPANTQIVHAHKNEDGEPIPFATGPEMTPIRPKKRTDPLH